MALADKQKASIVKKFQRHASDFGSPEVQVALLTANIKQLTGHFKQHNHDFHSERGLLAMINKRKKLLRYLSKRCFKRYKALMDSLGLRVAKHH